MRTLIALFICLFISSSFALESPEPLPADKAFVFSSYVGLGGEVIFLWTIAPGYYLYQDKLKITLAPTGFSHPIVMPSPATIKDMMGDRHRVYMGTLKIATPTFFGNFSGPMTLTVSYQGCAVNGFCYTPIKKYFTVSALGAHQITLEKTQAAMQTTNKPTEKNIFSHNLFFIIASFLGLGLLLAFTPCVLPIIPILSTIILGQKKSSSALPAFILSVTYVLGMALTYAFAGMLIAWFGKSIQIYFQEPWVIVLFSVLFIVLAFSLFGLFDLRLPTKLQHRLTQISMKQKGGTITGVFLMGCLSTLIVSPCVSPPLVGVLAYIAQTGNSLMGALALFSLGMGMGIPLLLIGTSLGRWLPKSGFWMDWIRKLLSLLMFGVALWMLSRVWSGTLLFFVGALSLMLFGLYNIFYYQKDNPNRTFLKWMGSFIACCGIILLIQIPLHASVLPSSFITVNNAATLNQELLSAKQNHQPVMIDFFAKWCGACVIMDETVLNREDVISALSSFKKIRMDITNNNAFDQAMMKQFNVIAPPVIIFIDREGNENLAARIVGEVDAKAFLKNLKIIEESDRAK